MQMQNFETRPTGGVVVRSSAGNWDHVRAVPSRGQTLALIAPLKHNVIIRLVVIFYNSRALRHL